MKSELAKIVGAENVLDDDETLRAFGSDESLAPSREPDLVARPGGAEEVQELVRWARKTGAPLIPVSSGPPRWRGDTIPKMGGVTVDLSRMKKIIRVDRRNRMAMVEPGVTFAELLPELEKEGMRLNLPLGPRASKSVVASVLEREPVTMPRYQWDVSDPLCTLEVIFGTGELLRTGEAAGEKGVEAQWRIGGAQKFPLGPHQVDYHRLVQGAQGTMGIVTWAVVKTELTPVMQKTFFLPVKRPEEAFPLAYKILRVNMADELLLLNAANLSALIAEDAAEARKLRRELPPWTLVYVLSAGERHTLERLEQKEKDTGEMAQACGATPSRSLDGIGEARILPALRDARDPYWRTLEKGGKHDIFFVSTLDRSPAYLDIVRRTAEEAGYPTSELGFYLQPMVQGTSCHVEVRIPYDKEDRADKGRADALFGSVTAALLGAEAFFSRPYGPWAEPVYRRNAPVAGALRKVKKVFDPAGIMNPGRLCF